MAAPAGTTLTYQWTRDGAAIPGATGLTYTLTAADTPHTIAVLETATNAAGSVTVTSATVAVGASTFVPATFTYDWQTDRSGTFASTGAATTNQAYVVTLGDVGHEIRCRVIATNPGGSTIATSAPVGPVAPSYGTYSKPPFTSLRVWFDGQELTITFPYDPKSQEEAWLLDSILGR